MKAQVLIVSGILLVAFASAMAPIPAQAKTEKVCIEEWKQLEATKKTEGQKRKDFIEACRKEAAAPPAAPAPTPSATAPAPAPKPTPRTTTTAPAAAPVAVGKVVYPSAISPKYSKEKPGKARELTCLDQYRANKLTNSNGGLKWIQKGGGYYHECNERLKG